MKFVSFNPNGPLEVLAGLGWIAPPQGRGVARKQPGLAPLQTACMPPEPKLPSRVGGDWPRDLLDLEVTFRVQAEDLIELVFMLCWKEKNPNVFIPNECLFSATFIN